MADENITVCEVEHSHNYLQQLLFLRLINTVY